MSVRTDYLRHHGILGMKWGVRRYQNYDGTLKSAGKKRYSDSDGSAKESDEATKKKGLTDKQKKYIKIGVAAVATGLAVYGGYKLAKSGKLDGLADKIKLGKDRTKELLAGDITDSVHKTTGEVITSGTIKTSDIAANAKSVAGFSVLNKKESLDELVKNVSGNTGTVVNPNRDDPTYRNNCTRCAIATYLRYCGLDVTAKDVGGATQDPLDAALDAFKNSSRFDGQIRTLSGNAKTFGQSKESASAMLLDKFGRNGNAAGTCVVKLKNRDFSHAFNWFIEDGVVKFVDGQSSNSPINTNPDAFWAAMIDQDGPLHLSLLSGSELNVDALRKYVE